MNHLKNILVGVDFSDCSKSALHQAARMAKWKGAAPHVLHVNETPITSELVEAIPLPLDELRAMAVGHARKNLEVWLAEAISSSALASCNAARQNTAKASRACPTSASVTPAISANRRSALNSRGVPV